MKIFKIIIVFLLVTIIIILWGVLTHPIADTETTADPAISNLPLISKINSSFIGEYLIILINQHKYLFFSTVFVILFFLLFSLIHKNHTAKRYDINYAIQKDYIDKNKTEK
jgi:hypothetical protein